MYRGMILPCAGTHRSGFACAGPSYCPRDLGAEDLLPLVTSSLNPVVPFVLTCFHCARVSACCAALPGISNVDLFQGAGHNDEAIRTVIEMHEKIAGDPVE